MDRYVLELAEIDRAQVAVAGGKGALLGELSRIEGICVPDGFCVTTDAFARILARASINAQLERLSQLQPGDRRAVRTLSAEIRRRIEAVAMPAGIASAIVDARARLGGHAYAVRSSATAEDLPTASFAGQHDSFLNVVGTPALLRHVARCWASLFTERATSYRLRNGVDQRNVRMAVIVQRMVRAQAAGVLFTADPVTSSRRVVVIEAVAGLGEALVSGLVNADTYRVRDGELIATGSAAEREPPRTPALTDAQALRLAQLGRRIEAHFGQPQDVEWCLAEERFRFVQSRPITTLFPIPAAGDDGNHVYVSVGHQQMMTDPMKPLGLSFWQMTTPRPMAEAGGRLFVDVTRALASPGARDSGRLRGLGRSDPLIGDALRSVLERGDFIATIPDEGPGEPSPPSPPVPVETDPLLVAELIERSESSLAALRRDIGTRSGPALLDFIRSDIDELRRLLFDPLSLGVIMAAIEASWWLNDRLEEWLGEKSAADALTQSVPGNVTSQMGLALLDVADAIRPHPEVVAFLERTDDDGFVDRLATLAGGAGARDAIAAFLDKHGMRGVGEIDITRPRWSERPTTLIPTILANVRNFDPGAGPRRFEEGLRSAREAQRTLLARVRVLPDGAHRAAQTERMIDRLRTFMGYREYPKYGMVSRYFVYKRALLEEAARLVAAGVLREREDIFFLRFEELRDVVCTQRADQGLIRRRREEFHSYEALTPPRVLTSDGEVVSGDYRRTDVPAGALAGLPVSAGTVEGRARVIAELADADLEPGDILVTAYTDPSWTPLFVTIGGLVTEVGGAMTHGAVIAREYGLPAVVGVEQATRLIRDGRRIRVHGSDGYIEILE